MATSKGTILVIDDNAGFRKIYRDRLIHDGYEVVEAGDGEEGLNILRSQKIDMVICDIVMPKKDGRQVLAEMSQDQHLKNVPVIILSVLGDENEIKQDMQAGASDYLIKGMYTPNDLLSKVGALLARTNLGKFAQKYDISVKPNTLDAVKLAKDLGFVNQFVCERCNKERILELMPQLSHDGWFDAHFVCPCGDSQAKLA